MATNSTEASTNAASSLTPVSPFTTDDTTAFNSSFNDSSNATEGSSYFKRNEELAKVEIALLSTILYLALFGNILVLVVLRLRRQKLTRMKWFIIHLSLADIFVAIFHILPQLLMDVTNQFYGGDFICRAVKYVSSLLWVFVVPGIRLCRLHDEVDDCGFVTLDSMMRWMIVALSL